MSALARILARELWWMMLWLMRRPWMKRLQRASMNFGSSDRRQRVLAAHKRQNAFALKHGLNILVVMMNILLASIALTLAFRLALILYESGALTGPGR